MFLNRHCVMFAFACVLCLCVGAEDHVVGPQEKDYCIIS